MNKDGLYKPVWIEYYESKKLMMSILESINDECFNHENDNELDNLYD